MDQVRPLVGARYAALGTFDPDGAVERFITSGITAEERARIGPIPQGHGLIGLIVRENRPIRIDDIATDPRRYGFPPHHPEMHTLLGVPVTVQGRTVGDLYLTERLDGKPFSDDDQRLVETFALHAGIAIENARLHEQIRRLAVVDERERISNDLHDGIIQNLYAVGLSLEDVPELAHDDPDEAERRVERAIDSLHLTIRDIRNFIFGLRPELLGGTTLADGLGAIASEFRYNSMIEVEVARGPDRPRARRQHDRTPAGRRQRGAEQRRPPLGRDDRDRLGGDRRGGRADRRRSRTTAEASTPRSRAPLATRAWRTCAPGRPPSVPPCVVDERPVGHARRDPAAGRRADDLGGSSRTMTEPAVPAPLTLLIVDDHEVVRQGLSAMLDRRPNFQVVAEAGTVAEAIAMARRFEPNLIVMDVRLPDGSGIEACREIRAELPETRVVMLTSYPDEEAVIAAIVAGASGYLLKQVRARDLVAALEAVGRGESLLDPAVTGKVLERMRRIALSDEPDELSSLTQQERKILALVAEGKTNKEIAAEVFLSDKTVKNYVSSILAKLNLERRAQAAAYVAKLKHPSD